jgi:hypothetical protein
MFKSSNENFLFHSSGIWLQLMDMDILLAACIVYDSPYAYFQSHVTFDTIFFLATICADEHIKLLVQMYTCQHKRMICDA